MRRLLAAALTPVALALVGWHLIPACAAEDSNGACRWDAAERGNGTGEGLTRVGDYVIHLERTHDDD